MKILVTGGAGFIGSFLVDKLIEQGHQVTVFDNLEPQVHLTGELPEYFNPNATFVRGDMCDYDAVEAVIQDVDVIFHEASMVGVGQSQYEVVKYVKANTLGTANLWQALINTRGKHHVKKVMVAASMSSYGEGVYECPDCGTVRPPLRGIEQMEQKQWELLCPGCNKVLTPVPTSEDAKQNNNSIYALTKMDQEQMCLIMGQTYDIPTVALRYFNVYGPRQSLSNPYTGVAAIFMSRIKNDNAPIIFEDGLQSRDFVSVHDIVDANITVMNDSRADYHVFNIGNGKPLAIKSIAQTLAKLYGKNIEPEITNQYRKGDVRHCYADTSKIKDILGWSPKVSFEEGMQELISWAETAESVDMVDKAVQEMKAKGLV